jgi:hypothetical protein
MNANASGMPPKLAATPENVVSAERIQRGVPSRSAAYATKSPTTPPISAVTRLISMLVLNASMYGWRKSSRTFENVALPVLFWNAPTRIAPAGRKRKAIVYAKNGRVPIHASERRLRPDRTSGRSADDAASAAMVPYPTFDGHSVAIFAFAFVCCPMLANFTFA